MNLTVSIIIGQLEGIATNSVGPAADIAEEAITVTQQYQSGQLSQSDYQELINDIKTEKLVLIESSEIAAKEELDNLFTEIVDTVTTIPIV